MLQLYLHNTIKSSITEKKHMSVAILTDTNSGITVEEGKTLGIHVIPMPVIVDATDYLEGENLTHAQLYEMMRADADVSTSQPAPQVIIDMWDALLKEYDEVVYIPMSSGLSNTCETATRFALDYNGKVFVADNRRISVTLRAAVLNAKKLADDGKSGKEIKEHLDADGKNSVIFVTVNSLKYLIKNGRATRAAAAIATVLNIKPVLIIDGGKLDAYKKIRGMEKSMHVMIEGIQSFIKTNLADVPPEKLRIGAAGTLETPEEIEHWLGLVQAAFPKSQTYYDPLSCSIACHVGIGAAGMGVSVIVD